MLHAQMVKQKYLFELQNAIYVNNESIVILNKILRKMNNTLDTRNIGLGKKKCRICDRNLTHYLTYLELSDLNQMWAVLLPFRRQRHYHPLIKKTLLICKKLRQAVFASLF